MNIQQLQYVIAVVETKHFETAANKCFVTQSTLSTMISKFEDEIGIKLFDRKKKPVELTTEGKIIIEQLKSIIKGIQELEELTKEIKGEVKGKLNISVIPTIAPYLLPLFLKEFALKFLDLKIVIKEEPTNEIIRRIKLRELDIGIVSTPIIDSDIIETHLYNEPFVYFNYFSKIKNSITANDIDFEKLCLLDEDHCLRTQIIKLCEIGNSSFLNENNFEYRAGSIDSLIRFVKANKAVTLLPLSASNELSAKDKKHISVFKNPLPYRSVGLITHRHFVKKKLLNSLRDEIVLKTNKTFSFNESKGNKLNPL
jgi:LysR family hydrogen peroxide-inducible transcriptional activator